MKKKIIIITSIIILFLIIGVICKYIANRNKIEETLVNAETLKLEDIENSEDYQGTLISRQSISLQPQVEGQITSIYVKAGDKVQKGQLLILINL